MTFRIEIICPGSHLHMLFDEYSLLRTRFLKPRPPETDCAFRVDFLRDQHY